MMRKKLLFSLLAAIIVLLVVILIKTYTYPFLTVNDAENNALSPDTSALPVKRLSGGLRIPTVSIDNVKVTNPEPFDKFKVYLQQAYPVIYSTMETFTINDYGLVFRWKGKNEKLLPILFLSHYDVVSSGYDNSLKKKAGNELNDSIHIFKMSDEVLPPVTEIAREWEYPPFSGAVAHGRIYGRGSLDMKGMLFAIMEVADHLILNGFTPERDMYFAFGYDEEGSGLQGAYKIAEYFEGKNLFFEAVYDEGGIIFSKGSFGMITRDVALIGLAEKGYLTVKIKVKGTGGHSSTPSVPGALGQAAIIIQNLENNQMKARLTQPVQKLLMNIGEAMGFFNRIAIANQWLFRPLLIRSLSGTSSTNALIRTTTAITMAKGSDAENVMPSIAEIVVNFRILPGNTVAEVTSHVEECCKGFDVEIGIVSATEASKISTEDTKSYEVMKKSISTIYPGTIITPYISIIGTDAIKYERVSKNVYRFLPVRLNDAEQQSIHYFNEYISIENYRKMIAYFKEVMTNFDGDPGMKK